MRRQGNTDEATAEYREAARLRPRDARVRDGLGTCLERNGDLDGAIAEYREAITIAPRAAAPLIHLAHALRDAGELGEAAHHYREAIRIEPLRPRAHVGLVGLLSEHGKPQEAEAAFREALQVFDGFLSDPPKRLRPGALAEWWYFKGKLLGQHEDVSEAREALSEAVRLDTKGDWGKRAQALLETLSEG